MITNIAFDIGGVLMSIANPDDVKEGVVDFLINEIGIEESKERITEIVNNCVPGWFSEEDTGINIWSKYFPSEVAVKIVDRYKYFHANRYQPVESMIDLCRKLSQKYQVGILSNFSKEFVLEKNYFNREMFNPVIFSGLVNVKKPNPEIYKIYCEAAKCLPEDVIFVDDKKENVEAAIKFGMTAILFFDQKQFEEELRKLNII